MLRWTRSSWTRPSKKVEVFILFPCGGVLARPGQAVLAEELVEAAELAALQGEKIVDEHVAELAAEKRVPVEGIERVAQARRQHRALGRVRLVVARPGLQLALDAIQAGDDLRGEIEVGVGRRLADAVLEPRGRIAGAAEHADHGAAVIEAPAGAVGRERVGLEAPVAVDRRRG